MQLDLILPKGGAFTEAAIDDAVAAVAGLERAIVVGSYHLDPARRLVAAIPGARLGYDPTLAAPRGPKGLLRHLARRRAGVALAYLRFAVVVEAEAEGFPLVRRLLDLGIETDVWTVNPGPGVSDTVLSRLIEAGVRQITTDAPDELARRIAALGTSRQP